MGLCCLGALRGLCGFCARVELGGYMTCGVFAFHFVFSPCFLSFYLFAYLLGFAFVALCLSSCLVLFVLVSLCFLFPLRTIRKKKGRAVLVRPLLSCCGLVMQNKASRSRKIRNR